ncbi:MAG: hypothetical protein ABR548_09450 [Actinomycetota bacterium]|nr:hypothetical protein [Actinomycetota bacterium]
MDKDIEHLFGLPLAEFTQARNALVAKARANGDTKRANEIKSLKKPSAAAWVVNQLARREPTAISDLIGVGGRLRKAQRKAMSKAGAADLRAATQDQRTAIAALSKRAAVIMKESGIAATRANLAAVEDTLAAAATDEEAAEELKSGTLSREMHRVGFGDVAGLTVVGNAEIEEPEERVDAEAAKKRAAALAADARTLETEAKKAERTAKIAKEKLDRLRAGVAAAEKIASEARFAAGTKRKAADDARAKAERAQRR